MRTILIMCIITLASGLSACKCECEKLPNLVVPSVQLNWDAANKKVIAQIANTGTADAGPFVVYFNGDQDPQPQFHGTQSEGSVAGLAVGASVTLEIDFAPLAHQANGNLTSLKSITVIADPKNLVVESNENDNSATKNL